MSRLRSDAWCLCCHWNSDCLGTWPVVCICSTRWGLWTQTTVHSWKIGDGHQPKYYGFIWHMCFLFLFFLKMKHEKHEKHPRSLTVVAPFPRHWGAPKERIPLPSINPAGHRSLGPRRMSRFQQLLPPKDACDIATRWNGMDGGWWCRCNWIVWFF